MIEATFKLRESKLGPDHPHTINSRNNLAAAYWTAGQPHRAVPLWELNLKQTTAKFRSDNPKTLLAQVNLGVAHRDAGRPAEAARLMEEALRLAQGRPQAMAVVKKVPSDLIRAYEAYGAYEKAESLCRELLATASKAFGPEDPRTADALRYLGHDLLKQRKWSNAEPILRECLTISTKTMADLWGAFNIRSLLGDRLLGQGKNAEAERLIVSGYEGLRVREATIPPTAKFRLSDAADRVVRLYDRLGRSAQAAALLGVTTPPNLARTKEDAPVRSSKP